MMTETVAGPAMTPKQRVMKFFAREPVDCLPCFSGMGNVTLAGLEPLGLDFASLHTDAEKMAAAAATTPKQFGFDCAVVPFAISVEAEALGCEVNYYQGASKNPEEIYYPTIKAKYVETASDIKLPVGGPEKSEAILLVAEAIRLLKAEIGDEVPVGAWVLGPFTLAGQIMELDHLLKMPLKAPQEMEHILDVLADFLVGVLQVYRAAGADYLTIREPGASSNVIRPSMFRDLVVPRLERIFTQVASPKVLHICGKTNDIVTAMKETGADALSVDHRNDVAASRKELGDEVILLGNFNCMGLLVEEAPETAARIITAGLNNGLSAIWPGCDIWPTAKPENLRAVVEATHAYRPNGAGKKR